MTTIASELRHWCRLHVVDNDALLVLLNLLFRHFESETQGKLTKTLDDWWRDLELE